MVFGFSVKPEMLVLGGVFLFAILLFQFLQGKRIIKFKGPMHTKVHRTMAWVLLATTVFHGFMGTVYGLELVIG